MKKKRVLKPLILVFVLIIVPGVFYVLLVVSGENRYKPLPIFGPRYVDTLSTNKADTTYHKIRAFDLVDQDSNSFQYPKTFKKKIIVFNFFFASCPTICPKMNTEMKTIVEKFKDNDLIRFVSITVDPERDTPQNLKTYSRDFSKDNNKWKFLTGNKKLIYDLARTQFFINATKGDGGPDDFIHSIKFILLDSKGQIRGYYDSDKQKNMNKLIGEIRVLIAEEVRNRRKIS